MKTGSSETAGYRLAFPLGFESGTAFPFAMVVSSEEALAGLARTGFHGVELVVRDPNAVPWEALAEGLQATGLQVASIEALPDPEAYAGGLASMDDTVRAAAIRHVRQLIREARILQCPVHLTAWCGPAFRESGPLVVRRDDAFRILGDIAADHGVSLTVSPHWSGDPVTADTVAEVLDWRERLSRPNVGLQLDSLYLHAMEAAPTAALVVAGTHCRHIVLSDTRRQIPGHGGVDFPGLLRHLDPAGFTGCLTVHAFSMENPASVAQAAFRTLSILRSAIPSEG